ARRFSMTTALAASTTDKRIQILAYVLGVAHVIFGVTKLAALPALVEQFHGWQLPPWMMYFVGVAQLLGGVGFFVRNLRLPSSFAMGLVMIGATVTVLASGNERPMALLTLVIAALCFVVAGHRLVQFAREFVADEAAKRAPTRA
ncbi:MAG: DoxX family protein, partial [Byssovorax sp.]